MKSNQELENIANKLRIDILNMLTESKSGHPGGSLSACEILSVLYFDEMNIDPKNPEDENRDRFILSKGHAAPVLYSALAEKNYFDKKELNKLRKIDSMLQGHPDMKGTPGVDMSTGSLGQGISAACGIAKSGKIFNKDYRVYTLLGDGEVQEGIVWEAAMFAGQYKLDNLVAFLDNNGLQIDGRNDKIMNIQPIDEKFEAFGWNVMKIDGHSIEEIREALRKARETKGKPSMIIAKTIKGKGVSFMEDICSWHGKAPSIEERDKAIKEIESRMGGAE
ncbi:MAG: transketolase [Andreesenia angusta]|nr:transketolase [Andreesenia angusta]